MHYRVSHVSPRFGMYGGHGHTKHKECYCTCLSLTMMLTFNFLCLESIWRAFWWLPSIRIIPTQCKSLGFIICKNPPTFAAFVVLSLSPHLCPSLTSLPSSLFFLIPSIPTPRQVLCLLWLSMRFIWAQTVRLTLAQVLSFHGNFIIVLDAFQAPLDTGALLMSKETCMKRGDAKGLHMVPYAASREAI